MSSFGVTSTGFNPKLIADVLSDFETQQKSDFGPGINTGGESVLGQLNATVAASIAEGWEVLGAVYRSLYPDSATGEALDNVSAITGVTREPATKSAVDLVCSGTAGVILLTGRVISVDATGERFVSTADATIGGGGTVSVPFESENFGPINMQTGQTLTIETPVAGWSSVTAADAELGEDLETDAELRLRRTSLLRFQGSATVEAIRADLLDVDDVVEVFVFENPSTITDGRNLPPKSIECIVDGGTDADVAEAIFNSKAAGIDTYGHAPNDVTETVTDSQGTDHTINFTRADPIDIYIRADLDYDPALFPSDGSDQIKAALKALVESGNLGATLVYERLQAEVFSVSGVVDYTSPVTFYVDRDSPGTGVVNITLDVRENAVIDTGDITLNLTAV